MLKTNSLIWMAAAALMIGTNGFTQDCGSCGGDFGYSNASVTGCRGGRGFHQRHHELNQQVMARNDAWPKPFDCADRQLYFSIWSEMLRQGVEQQCVLSEAHFDSETNELNSFGLHTVAGIMQNMPTKHKHVFINRGADQMVSEVRLQNVQSVVSTFYSQIAPQAQVAFSSKIPSSVSGQRVEGINKLFYENQAVPVIPISSGSESVASSVRE